MSDSKAEPNSVLDSISPLLRLSPTIENVLTQITPTSITDFPAEIVALIADQTDSWERNSLTRVNRFFNGACTTSLYSGPIRISTIHVLRSLSETLLQLRPEFALMVKDLVIRVSIEGFVWSARRTPSNETSAATLARGGQAIAACINLRRLSVEAATNEAVMQFSLSRALFKHELRLPLLRHLSLDITLDAHVLAFVQRHLDQFLSLSIWHQDTTMTDKLRMGRELVSQFSLPLPSAVTTFQCSPTMAPIFIPNSRVENVSFFWPHYLNETKAQGTDEAVEALTQSQSSIIVLTYSSPEWNTRFMRLAAEQLPELQYLSILNGNIYGSSRMDDSNDAILYRVADMLPSFKSLKVLRLSRAPSHRLPRKPRTAEDDFQAVQKWASLCPTLIYCKIPQTRVSWIRHPRHDFFVIDKDITSPDYVVKEYGEDWEQTFLHTRTGAEYSASWAHNYEDVRKLGILEVVNGLKERGTKI